MKWSYLLLVLSLCVACKSKSNYLASSFRPQTSSKIYNLTKINELESQLTETSGLVWYDNHIITHNDSGDQATLYFLNLEGEEQQRVCYDNAMAIDWEDITRDSTYMYVADIGNNLGDRKDLVIYQMPLKDLYAPDAPIKRLSISYPDQVSFTPADQEHPFDAESLVSIASNLYIFSKNWKDQTTTIYQILPDKPNQKAQIIKTFNVKGLITGATFNGVDAVMLCGYNSSLTPFVYRVDYHEGQFDFQTKEELKIEGGAQVEAIAFWKSSPELEYYFISCEASNIILGEDEAESPAQLYQMAWKK